MRQLGSLGWAFFTAWMTVSFAILVPAVAPALEVQSESDPTPVSCLRVEDRLDVIDERLNCEAAAAGLYAAGFIRPMEVDDTATGLAGCDAGARASCTGELWLCFGVGAAEH